jgi:hypothetical protein
MFVMHFAVVAALAATSPGSLGEQALFSPDQTAAVSERVRSGCGHANADELKPLAEGLREAALVCLVRITAEEGNRLLPKEIEPGVMVKSARVEEELLLVLTLQLQSEQARALAANPADFSNRFANRSCRENRLVQLIDAGAAVVYQFQDVKGETLRLDAVTECRSSSTAK